MLGQGGAVSESNKLLDTFLLLMNTDQLEDCLTPSFVSLRKLYLLMMAIGGTGTLCNSAKSSYNLN